MNCEASQFEILWRLERWRTTSKERWKRGSIFAASHRDEHLTFDLVPKRGELYEVEQSSLKQSWRTLQNQYVVVGA